MKTSLDTMREALAVACPAIEDYQALGPASEFRHHSGIIQVGDSKLVFGSHTPVYARRVPLQQPTIFLPFSGAVDIAVEGHKMSAAANLSALLLTGAGFEITTSIYAGLMVIIDPDALHTTAQAMLGQEQAVLPLDVDRKLQLQLPNGLRIDHLLTLLLQQIALVEFQPALIAMLGLEDQIRRLFVLLLADPAHKEEQPRPGSARSRKVLSELCDQIDADLCNRITLTQLEARSGLSSRTLQYTFQKYLGCSPMQWVRMRRLEGARHHLSDVNNNQTILQIALESGFSGAGEFSRAFKQHFGVRPSAVRGRRTHPRSYSL